MKKKMICFCLVLSVMSSFIFAGSKESFKERHKKITALDAKIKVCFETKNYPHLLILAGKAFKIMPENHRLHYQMARAYALNGKATEAIDLLTPLIQKGMYLDTDNNKDFDNLKENNKFRALLAKIAQWRKPNIHSKTAFTLPERDLIPEGITYDPVDKAFYLSSLHKCKVVRVDSKGNATDFVKPRQDGMLPSAGMCIDSKRRRLWVCNSFGYPKPHIDKKYFNCSAVFKYDLDSGKLIKKYPLPQAEAHFLNDVTVAPDGTVFISDSHFPDVYTIDNKKDKIERLATLPMTYYPNGIAYSPKTGKVFLATQFELSTIDRKSGAVSKLAHSKDIFIAGGDGLYYRNGTLLTIQNGFNPPRIVSMTLDEKEERVTDLKVLERNNPALIIPTTGIIVGDWFYFIADAQFGKSDENGNYPPVDKLDPVKVLRLKL
ncbi:MAG: SMP-30/gluconolactonase/LRE family protein [bacterium]|nr:SMP-30/gluconolactonase/LRE family protein [bacterium]